MLLIQCYENPKHTEVQWEIRGMNNIKVHQNLQTARHTLQVLISDLIFSLFLPVPQVLFLFVRMYLKIRGWDTLISKWKGNKQQHLLVMMSWKKLSMCTCSFFQLWGSKWKSLNFRTAKLVGFIILLSILSIKVDMCECLCVPRNYIPRSMLGLSTWKQRNYCESDGVWDMVWVWCLVMFGDCTHPQFREQKMQELLLVQFEVQSYWNETFRMWKKMSSITKAVKSQWKLTIFLPKQESE